MFQPRGTATVVKGSGRIKIVAGAIAVALVALLLGYAFMPVSGEWTLKELVATDSPQTGLSVTNAVSQDRKAPRFDPTKPIDVAERFPDLSGPDLALATNLQEAMDSDDHEKIISAAVKALRSANPDVRRDAVDALGWCGKDALVELTGALADPDDDVRDSAINNWECALSEVDDSRLRYSTALSVMGAITKEDALDSISGQFGNAAQEYIDEVDDEETQSSRRVEVVQKLLDIIDGERQVCSEKAKEAYNDLTGHEWISVDEAERYLQDPDNYEDPEDKE